MDIKGIADTMSGECYNSVKRFEKPYKASQCNNGKVCTCSLGSRVALMCPSCFDVYRITQTGNITAISDSSIDLLVRPAYHIQCSNCDKYEDAIVLDDEIADAVSLLNKIGLLTEMCCSGHITDKINGPFIKFKQDYGFKSLPDGWYTDGVFIRASVDIREEAIDRLNEWTSYLCRRA